SAILLVFNGKYLTQVTRKDWISATALGVVGNLFFYWLLASAVQLAGAPIAGAFTAVIPISVAIVANTTARQHGVGVPWSSLVFPLSLVAAGMVCLNWTEFSYFLANSNEPPAGFWLGVFYAFLSLLVWTWYPISNANWLIAHPKISPMFWTAAQGAATLPTAAIGLAAYAGMAESTSSLWEPTPAHFFIGVLFLGIVCSWLAICFWNDMSRRLTPALGGQMIIFETIFAVIYAHIMRHALPTTLMSVGMVLLLAGVFASVRVFRRTEIKAV
ncbi:DMT family transporter, partial [Sutterella wadsworthensis]